MTGGALFPLGIQTILVAHIMFNISYVIVTVRARMAGFDRRLEEAAMDLGANEWATFWKVTFPLIFPGIMAAALLAFSLSIDDFIITNFTSGTSSTFPIWVWGSIRNNLPPQIHVIGTGIFVGAIGLVVISTVLQGRSARQNAAARPTVTDVPGAIPRPCRRPAGLGPDHEHRGRPRRGLVADHAVRRPLPRLLVGDRGHEHRPRPPEGRGGGPGAGREAPPRPAEHRLPRAGAAAATSRLSGLLPGGPWGAFLSNSGAEAVEAAVKLARVATGRPVIISFRGGFHGRTAQTMALTTAKDVYRAAFEPLPGSVYHTKFPYCYRAAGGAHAPDANCTCDWEAELDLLFHQVIYPNRVAAIIVEPVQGEGGYIVPPPTFLPRLREITREHGILLIADEVQTGFGRTGELFAVQHWDVEPDILVMAKGIASGLPLSGIIAKREILDRFAPGHPRRDVRRQRRVVRRGAGDARRHRGGGPRRERPGPRRAARRRPPRAPGGPPGDRRRPRARLHGRHGVREARRGRRRVPDADLTKRVIAEALARKLIVLSAGSYGNVSRLIPPLVTTADEVDLALSILEDSIRAAGA